jgi:RNA polymerase sigma-70 factor (ECF subfamily)
MNVHHLGTPEPWSELVDAYLAAQAAQPSIDAPNPDPATLASALTSLCTRGRAAHPDLAVSDEAFVAHLAKCGAPLDAGADAICAGDLYICCAALAGVPGAVDRLRNDHVSAIANHLRVIEMAASAIDDIEQRVWEALLVGREDRAPRLRTYSGKGPLGVFLGIAAQRMAIDGFRRRSVERRTIDGLASDVDAISGDAELAFVKLRYRQGFNEAIRDALALLEDRHRMVLRLHVVDGISLDRIAQVYRVAQSTVSRWVAAARESIRAETCRLLGERMQLSEAEFDSLAALVVSQLDVSIRTGLVGKSGG